MSNVVLTLGGVPFQDFEVPEKIQFGGAQRLAVNELIGGGRVVNALGADDGEIIFRGIFSGGDASGRASLLDAARALGTAIPLVWGDFFYTVAVAEFVAEYTKPWWIPFAVRCVVVTDPVAELAGLIAPVADLISNDIAAAASFSGLAGISLAGLSAGTISGFATVQSMISASITANGMALSNGAAALGNAADAPSGIAAMNGLSATSSQLAGLNGLNGYINRAAANIAGQLS